MTKQEVVKVVTLIVMSYPASERFKDESALQGMTSVWTQMFKDDNPRLVELAIQRHIATSKWPPSIAEIREQMVTLQHPELIPPDLAWAAVADRKAAEKEWKYEEDATDALPLMIARTVQTIGWYDLWEKEEKARQIFLELYRPAYERARERAMLPKALSDAVEKTEHMLGRESHLMLESAKERREETERKEKEYEKEWRRIWHEATT